MATPCPACDVEKMGFKPLMAFAYGVALGECFPGDMHQITELMCETHRPTYCLAMAHAGVAMNTRGDDDEPFAEEVEPQACSPWPPPEPTESEKRDAAELREAVARLASPSESDGGPK